MISVIIPTKNAGVRFRDTLEAIHAQDTREQVEIVVVDSGSTDGTREVAAGYGAKVVEIRPEEFNHGLTRNRGISLSRGELVLMTVQDAIPCDGRWLPALAEAVRSDPKVAGAYSRHMPHTYANQFTRERIIRSTLSRPDRTVQSLDLIPKGRTVPAAEMYLHYAFNNVSSMMRRDVWERFPIREAAFAEDLDWSKRVIDAGYRIVYEPASMVYHSHERSVGEEFRRGYVTVRSIQSVLGVKYDPAGPVKTAVDFMAITRYSLSFLLNPYIRKATERLGTAAFAFSHSFGAYMGYALGRKAAGLERFGWFRTLDSRLSRGL